MHDILLLVLVDSEVQVDKVREIDKHNRGAHYLKLLNVDKLVFFALVLPHFSSETGAYYYHTYVRAVASSNVSDENGIINIIYFLNY